MSVTVRQCTLKRARHGTQEWDLEKGDPEGEFPLLHRTIALSPQEAAILGIMVDDFIGRFQRIEQTFEVTQALHWLKSMKAKLEEGCR